MSTYILTLVSAQTLAPKLDRLLGLLDQRGLKASCTKQLNSAHNTQSVNASYDACSIEFSGALTQDESKSLARSLATDFELDAIIQDKTGAEIPKKLACFDMDSTLIQHEVMDELAIHYGIGTQISKITESAMRGEISFEESFTGRLACLKGFEASKIPEIAASLKLTPGAQTLIKTLRAQGVKIAILSGGFRQFAQHLQGALGELDAICANDLGIENGLLTGKISNHLIDEHRKVQLIDALCDEYKLNANEVMTVGDGANDIPMLLHAGLGVAYHAKPLVQEKARHCLNHTDLSAILYVLGYAHDSFV